MKKMKLILLTLILYSIPVCYCWSQNSNEVHFGTKGIDHLAIATEFMKGIEDERYEDCYKLMSEDYKSRVSIGDFIFRMKMLKNFSNKEEFHHYNTTFIGLTPDVGIRKLKGEIVTKDIMPEYDFTVKSEADNALKQRQAFLRFENEDSDKIQVINYSKHKFIDPEKGISQISQNPFFMGSYILIVETKGKLLTDIRGRDLRNIFFKSNQWESKEIFHVITLDQVEKLLSDYDVEYHSLILVSPKDGSNLIHDLREIGDKNGFKVFNYNGKELKSYYLEDAEKFIAKYKGNDSNPLK